MQSEASEIHSYIKKYQISMAGCITMCNKLIFLPMFTPDALICLIFSGQEHNRSWKLQKTVNEMKGQACHCLFNILGDNIASKNMCKYYELYIYLKNKNTWHQLYIYYYSKVKNNNNKRQFKKRRWNRIPVKILKWWNPIEYLYCRGMECGRFFH